MVTSLCPRRDYSEYIPGAKFFVVKLVADAGTGQVLGCQVLGEGDGVKRIDVVSTTMKFNGDVKALADLDLAYAPAYSTAIDAIAHAANVIRNKMDGLAQGIGPVELKRKLDGGGDFVLVDCRGEAIHDGRTIPDRRSIVVPFEEMRDRLSELPRDKEIIIFCNTSITAYFAERLLRHMGYDDVKFADGSIKAWPYELETKGK